MLCLSPRRSSTGLAFLEHILDSAFQQVEIESTSIADDLPQRFVNRGKVLAIDFFRHLLYMALIAAWSWANLLMSTAIRYLIAARQSSMTPQILLLLVLLAHRTRVVLVGARLLRSIGAPCSPRRDKSPLLSVRLGRRRLVGQRAVNQSRRGRERMLLCLLRINDVDDRPAPRLQQVRD